MEMDLAQRLPEEVLADVLGCLPPRSLAAARCVCRAWHAIIDARRLLDRDLLPLSLAGFFINFADLKFAEFFFRPSTDAAAISSDLHFVPTEDVDVEDICNGLVLLDCYVVNPATRRWASLPPRPPPPMGFELFDEQDYIMFDPAESLHYQVLIFLHVPHAFQFDAPMSQQEWPPSPLVMNVFSSASTARWEERSFIRQGDALGTLADMQLAEQPSHRHHAVYWHGQLYVHYCHFVMRVSLSNCTYQAIKLPIDVDVHRYPKVLLGRSKKGVYFAALDRQCRLRVWILNESCEWLPKHDSSLHHHTPPRQNHGPQTCGSWILADVNYNFHQASNPIYNEESSSVQDKLEWYSDNEDVSEDRIGAHTNEHITILGFHPYREVRERLASKRGLVSPSQQSAQKGKQTPRKTYGRGKRPRADQKKGDGRDDQVPPARDPEASIDAHQPLPYFYARLSLLPRTSRRLPLFPHLPPTSRRQQLTLSPTFVLPCPSSPIHHGSATQRTLLLLSSELDLGTQLQHHCCCSPFTTTENKVR